MTEYIHESGRDIPVCAEADICIAGGSCTGVFAAVRAARMGCRVILCEEMNALGGAAVHGLVNIWHTLYDTEDKQQVIAGLTAEVLERLQALGALTVSPLRSSSYNFNPCELAIELDRLTDEHKIEVRFHTRVCGVLTDARRLQAVLVEDQSGRRAIRASFFIDCTGDGDLAARLGLESFVNPYIQPPTACFHLQGDMTGVNLGELVREHGAEFGLGDDWGWSTGVAGCRGITMRADHHVFGVRCDIAEDLTRAEKTGRAQMRAFVSLLKKYGRPDTHYAITNFASYIGIRETVHYVTKFRADELSLLTGRRYDAPVLNGTYPTDRHHAEDMGISFKYLDGTMRTMYGKGTRTVTGNWREELGITTPPATYYQLPFEVLLQERWENFLCAGRMINADAGAFGALRVMVNLNQLGEAAGCAAAICLDEGRAVQAIDPKQVTSALRKGGSAV
ncbi:MAG: FAD-dependent oxidoreductase [Eubacteriales bacterium]